MKKLFLLIATVAITVPAMAQKSKKQNKAKQGEAAPAPVGIKDEIQETVAMHEHSRVTDMHHLLMQWAGHWTEEIKIWTNPEAEPGIMRTERDGRVVAEGRFLVSTIMGHNGLTPYEAQSVMGYDNSKKVFVKTWFDNLGTSILVLEGIYDEKAHVIDFKGTTTDPRTKLPVKVHQILRMADPNNQILEVYVEVKEGKEVKSMEVRSVRR